MYASPIIGRQPPRRSLFPTPAPSVTPDARSTPLLPTEEKEISDKGEGPTRMSTKFKLRRLQPPDIVEEAIADTPACSSSFIDVSIPYIDPPSPPPLQEQTRKREPIHRCTSVPNIIHEWTEPLTYRRNNCAHFLSEDCEPANTITKLLIATERLDLQDLWESRPKRGQVLVTPHGQHKTYLMVVTMGSDSPSIPSRASLSAASFSSMP